MKLGSGGEKEGIGKAVCRSYPQMPNGKGCG